MTQKQLFIFTACIVFFSFANSFGTGWLLRTYTHLYATNKGDLITAAVLGILVGLSWQIVKNIK